MSIPTTDDTAELVAAHPDWGRRIQSRTIHRTGLTTSRSGLEQRTQHRHRPLMVLEYHASRHDDEARRAIETIVQQGRKPLIVPWWPNGLQLEQAMPSDTIATLDVRPIAGDWDPTGFVYFWSRDLGGEWRVLNGISDRVLTLIDTGTHKTFQAGDWAFPGMRVVRQTDEATLLGNHHRAQIEKLSFRTL